MVTFLRKSKRKWERERENVIIKDVCLEQIKLLKCYCFKVSSKKKQKHNKILLLETGRKRWRKKKKICLRVCPLPAVSTILMYDFVCWTITNKRTTYYQTVTQTNKCEARAALFYQKASNKKR